MTSRISQSSIKIDSEAEGTIPSCIMSFNVSDPCGAAGLAADISTIASMGAYPLPVVTGVLIRDTTQIFDIQALDAEVIVDQARNVLEDLTLTGWKVGFLGSADNVTAVAEILSDYPDVPLIAYMPNLSFMQDSDLLPYCDAFRELVLPQTSVLVGSHQVLIDFLLPEWEDERTPSPRELAVAAAQHGTPFVLVTSIPLPDQFLENVLASPQGPMLTEKFERFEVNFLGAGDTLSAAITAMLAAENELTLSVTESLAYLDQALDNGFQPGMGQVVPDRMFWALPDEETDDENADEKSPDQDPESPEKKPDAPQIH
jgi:hydroxymethylpyrimidine/phosphomethylpyrimidine kinase